MQTLIDPNLSIEELNPTRFYALVDLIQSLKKKDVEDLTELLKLLDSMCHSIDQETSQLAKANNALLSEVRNTTRRKHNPFLTEGEKDDPLADLRHTLDGHNFMRVIFEVCEVIRKGFHTVKNTVEKIRPGKLLLFGGRISGAPETIEQLNSFAIQFNMNRPTITRFTKGVLEAERSKGIAIDVGRLVVEKLESYFATLVRRHTVEGIQVHRDPVITDLAISIYENVDANGEIRDGKKADEVSAYSIRKALIVVDAIQNGMVGTFIRRPSEFLDFIKSNLSLLWDLANQIDDLVKPLATQVRAHLDLPTTFQGMKDGEFHEALVFLDDLDPRNVTYKDKKGLLTAEERFELEFRNATIKEVVERLSKSETGNLIKYILDRKAKLHAYYQDENSFYVCKIGNGNPFTGEAPGALTITPGVKPVVNLDDVVGSGFDQVKEFIRQVRESARWHDFFLALSPSKSADKANALLIGPQGCHRKGQKILMFDGTLLPVEQVKVGDLLMGPDSTPRRVLQLHRGVQEMVEIVPTKGEPWVVNKSHMLTLVRTQKKHGGWGGLKRYIPTNEVKDVTVSEYLSWSKTQKHVHALFRVGVSFEAEAPLPLEPYFLGVLLGDGCFRDRLSVTNVDQEVIQEVHAQADSFGLKVYVESNGRSAASYHLSGTKGKPNPITTVLRELGLFGCDSETKFIPHAYKTASREDRLELLAGLIDTDGSLHGGCFDYVSKSRALADDITFVARSLGLAAYVKSCRKKSQRGTEGTYFRVMISGHTDQIPVRLPQKQAQKRQQVKDVLRTGFTTRELPAEEYFGFMLDGDHRYLLDDFTVTHNCGKSEVLRAVGGDRGCIGIYAQPSDFLTCWKGEAEKNPKRLFEEALKLQKESHKQVFVLIDEVDTILNDDHARGGFGATNLTTEFQQLMDGILQYPHIAVWAATNHPERIPMPMIRRFSKVAVVGELDQVDRVKLLKHFVGFLPIAHDFSEQAWQDAATKLEGAVGDGIRKVADSVWRAKVTAFIQKHPSEADKILEWLNTGERFHLSRFDAQKRQDLHGKLRDFMAVHPNDLKASVDEHLSNIAFRSEIDTAVETYARAKHFLTGIQRRHEGQKAE